MYCFCQDDQDLSVLLRSKSATYDLKKFEFKTIFCQLCLYFDLFVNFCVSKTACTNLDNSWSQGPHRLPAPALGANSAQTELMQSIIQAVTDLRCHLILLWSPNTRYATKENSEMENTMLINVQVPDFPLEK